MKKTIALIIILQLFLVSQYIQGQSGQSYVFIPDNSSIMIYSNSSGSYTLSHNSRIYSSISANIRKLSSAQRIYMAGDDPSGLAVSEKMRSHIAALKREIMNAEDFRNYLAYKESAIGQNIEIISRIRVLALQASSGILHSSDRELLQSEVEQHLRQIDMNAEFSSFNRKHVIPYLTAVNLGLAGFTIVSSPYAKIGLLDKIHSRLIRERSITGVDSNILQLRIEGKSYYMFNLQQSESRVRDLDFASEFTDFSSNMVLYKVNTGMILQKRP
jgi:flagellin